MRLVITRDVHQDSQIQVSLYLLVSQEVEINATLRVLEVAMWFLNCLDPLLMVPTHEFGNPSVWIIFSSAILMRRSGLPLLL